MATSDSPTDPPRWSAGHVIGATLVVLLVCAAFFLLYRFSTVFFIVFVAVVLATAMRPAVLWLERWRIPQWLGVLLIYSVVVIGVIGLIALIAPILISQSLELARNAPEYYANILESFGAFNNPLARAVVRQLPEEIPIGNQVTISGNIQFEEIGQAVSAIRSLSWGIFGLIATVLIVYFWILDREQIIRSAVLLAPDERRDTVRELWVVLEEKVGAFVRGQALLCLSIGVLSLIAFTLIGVPNAVLLGVLAGVFEVIPYVGPILTAVLAIVLTLAQAPEKILWVIIAFTLIQQAENALLVPRIMGHTVGVNAVVTLLAIAAFGSLLGVGGAIMAIPLAVVIQVLFQRVIDAAQQTPVAGVTGRDQFAVLRYEAQDLASDLRARIRANPERADKMLLEEELEELVMEVDQLLLAASTPGPEGAEPVAERIT